MTLEILELRSLKAIGAEMAALAVEARNEGHLFVQRLCEDWKSGANRFDAPGEILMGGYVAQRLVAVGGLNRDPYQAADGTGRLRHVYVCADVRRLGVGTCLVEYIKGVAEKRFSVLRLRTMTAEAASFYEHIGFRKTGAADATHRIDFRERSVSTPSVIA